MNIYYLLLLLVVSIVSAYVSTMYPTIKTRFLRVINKRRDEIDSRIDLLERRVKLHESKDGAYLNKFDEVEYQIQEIEEQIDNLAKHFVRKEKNTRDMIRTEVKEYLKKLQK